MNRVIRTIIEIFSSKLASKRTFGPMMFAAIIVVLSIDLGIAGDPLRIASAHSENYANNNVSGSSRVAPLSRRSRSQKRRSQKRRSQRRQMSYRRINTARRKAASGWRLNMIALRPKPSSLGSLHPAIFGLAQLLLSLLALLAFSSQSQGEQQHPAREKTVRDDCHKTLRPALRDRPVPANGE